MYVCMHVRMYVCMYLSVCMRACIYIYIYIHTHTYSEAQPGRHILVKGVGLCPSFGAPTEGPGRRNTRQTGPVPALALPPPVLTLSSSLEPLGSNSRGSICTTIMELGPKRPFILWFWGPNSIMVVYMDP